MNSKLEKRYMLWQSSQQPLVKEAVVNGFTVVSQQKRGLKGITGRDGSEIVPPVYDDVVTDGQSEICGLCFDGKTALAEIATGKLLTGFDYDSIIFRTDNHTIEIVKGEGHGLFDTVSRKVEVAAKDQYVSLGNGGNITWSYTEREGYTFHNTATGKKIVAGNNIEECFDQTHGHIFGIFDGKVSVINDDGHSDDATHRHIVASLNGRIELSNHDRRLHVVADIYGNVL